VGYIIGNTTLMERVYRMVRGRRAMPKSKVSKKRPGRKNLFGDQETVEIKIMLPLDLWNKVKDEADRGERPASSQVRIFLKQGVENTVAA